MEQALGVRLFDHLPRGWPLTEEGRELIERAARIGEEAHGFARAARGAVTLHGTVCLSVPPVFGSHFLVPRLAAFRRAYPAVLLNVVGETRPPICFDAKRISPCGYRALRNLDSRHDCSGRCASRCM
jgi:DNA-binding transcriptional LysR family regulator